jgi:hypothetical protein
MSGQTGISQIRRLPAGTPVPRTGPTLVAYAPGQKVKIHDTLHAVNRVHAEKGLGRLVMVLREGDPDLVETMVQGMVKGVPVDIIDLRGAGPPGSQAVDVVADFLVQYGRDIGGFQGFFTPMDKYVEEASHVSQKLANNEMLPVELVFLNPNAVNAICDKIRFQELKDAIDPDGSLFHHPWWTTLEVSELDAEVIRGLSGVPEAFYLLPHRGACARGVAKFRRDDPTLAAQLARYQSNLVYLNTDEQSGVRADRIMLVDRVRGPEFSIEVDYHDGVARILHVHRKSDTGDSNDPDGHYDKIYTSNGPMELDNPSEPETILLSQRTKQLMTGLREHDMDLGTGVFHIEARIAIETGRPYFLEINPRIAGSKVAAMLRLTTREAVDLYAIQMYRSLGWPLPPLEYRAQVGGDVTFFAAVEGDEESDLNRFLGYWLRTPGVGGQEDQLAYVGDWDPQRLVRRFNAILASASPGQVVDAYDRGTDLQYPVPSTARMRNALLHYIATNAWSGPRARLMEFESFQHAGAQFTESAAFYVGNMLAVADEQLVPDVGRAMVIALLVLTQDRLVPRAQPILRDVRQDADVIALKGVG